MKRNNTLDLGLRVGYTGLNKIQKRGFIMIEQQLYRSTPRIKKADLRYRITEKMDGSNLTFFRYEDELYVATRKNIFTLTDILDKTDTVQLKGLYDWLTVNGHTLLNNMNENSAIVGEWMGSGHIKYGLTPYKFYMFSKANVHNTVDEESQPYAEPMFEMSKVLYDEALFIYPFKDMTIPDFIGLVPTVAYSDKPLTMEYLDNLYEEYSANFEDRKVEGFIITQGQGTDVKKYVRHKSGKSTPHIEDPKGDYLKRKALAKKQEQAK